MIGRFNYRFFFSFRFSQPVLLETAFKVGTAFIKESNNIIIKARRGWVGRSWWVLCFDITYPNYL